MQTVSLELSVEPIAGRCSLVTPTWLQDWNGRTAYLTKGEERHWDVG
jgi:hypothetical protein